jgi:hypothetical protein
MPVEPITIPAITAAIRRFILFLSPRQAQRKPGHGVALLRGRLDVAQLPGAKMGNVGPSAEAVERCEAMVAGALLAGRAA